MVDLVGLHGGEIEEQHDHAAIFESPECVGDFVRGLAVDLARGCESAALTCATSVVGTASVFSMSKEAIVLRFAIFEDGEVVRLEGANEVSVLVADGDVDQDEFGLGVEGVVGVVLGGESGGDRA